MNPKTSRKRSSTETPDSLWTAGNYEVPKGKYQLTQKRVRFELEPSPNEPTDYLHRTQLEVFRTITHCASCLCEWVAYLDEQDRPKLSSPEALDLFALAKTDEQKGVHVMISNAGRLCLCPDHDYLISLVRIWSETTKPFQPEAIPAHHNPRQSPTDIFGLPDWPTLRHLDQRPSVRQRNQSCDWKSAGDATNISILFNTPAMTSAAKICGPKPVDTHILRNLETDNTSQDSEKKTQSIPPRSHQYDTKSSQVMHDIGETFDASTFDFDTDMLPVTQLDTGELVCQPQDSTFVTSNNMSPSPIKHTLRPKPRIFKAIRKRNISIGETADHFSGQSSGDLIDVHVFVREDLQAHRKSEQQDAKIRGELPQALRRSARIAALQASTPSPPLKR